MTVFDDYSMFGSIVHIMASSSCLLAYRCSLSTKHSVCSFVNDSRLCYKEYVHVHTYVRTYIHTYIHTYKHAYTHAYIYIYIYSYVHTYCGLRGNTMSPMTVSTLKDNLNFRYHLPG